MKKQLLLAFLILGFTHLEYAGIAMDRYFVIFTCVDQDGREHEFTQPFRVVKGSQAVTVDNEAEWTAEQYCERNNFVYQRVISRVSTNTP